MTYAIRSVTGSHKHVDGKTFCNVAYRVLDEADVSDEIFDHDDLEIIDVSGPKDPKLGGKRVQTGNGVLGIPVPAALESKQPRPARPSRGEKATAPEKPAKPAKPSKEDAIDDEFSKMSATDLRAKQAELGMPVSKAVGVSNAKVADLIRAYLAENPTA